MEDTLEFLAVQAERFNDEQRQQNYDLEAKKDALVLKNDMKKKQEEERARRDRE